MLVFIGDQLNGHSCISYRFARGCPNAVTYASDYGRPALLLMPYAYRISLAFVSRGFPMHKRMIASAIAAFALLSFTAGAMAQQLTIRAGTMLDGKGQVQRNALIAIDGAKITR